MLVLSRRSSESVVVGGINGVERLIKITVLEIGRGVVRLGFDASASLPVHRSEVWERIHAAGRPERPREGPAALVAGGGGQP